MLHFSSCSALVGVNKGFFMAIRIFGNSFENCGVGISAPADANVEMGGNRFTACGKAIDLREPQTLMRALGLSDDTPAPLVRELFEFLASAQRSKTEIAEKAESTGLFNWLAAGANAATLVSATMELYKHVPEILAALAS